jgi:hypothetical protein
MKGWGSVLRGAQHATLPALPCGSNEAALTQMEDRKPDTAPSTEEPPFAMIWHMKQQHIHKKQQHTHKRQQHIHKKTQAQAFRVE